MRDPYIQIRKGIKEIKEHQISIENQHEGYRFKFITFKRKNPHPILHEEPLINYLPTQLIDYFSQQRLRDK